MTSTDAKSAEKVLREGIPNRFVYVERADEEVKKTRALEGQLLVCQGCCCSKTEHGMPALPLAGCHFNRFIFDTAASDEWLNDDDWKKSKA